MNFCNSDHTLYMSEESEIEFVTTRGREDWQELLTGSLAGMLTESLAGMLTGSFEI